MWLCFIFCDYIKNELQKLSVVKLHVECGCLDTDRIGSIERPHVHSNESLIYQKKWITKEPFLYMFFLYFLNFIHTLFII